MLLLNQIHCGKRFRPTSWTASGARLSNCTSAGLNRSETTAMVVKVCPFHAMGLPIARTTHQPELESFDDVELTITNWLCQRLLPAMQVKSTRALALPL